MARVGPPWVQIAQMRSVLEIAPGTLLIRTSGRRGLWRNLHLDREMRERAEPRQPSAVIVRIPVLFCDHRDNRPEVPGTQAPKMKVGELVALALDGLPQPARQ